MAIDSIYPTDRPAGGYTDDGAGSESEAMIAARWLWGKIWFWFWLLPTLAGVALFVLLHL